MWLATGLWTLRQNKYIRADCRFGRPPTHSLQNATAVHLAGSAVMCRPAHARPVLPFVLSANNCRSELIHRMLLLDVAVTREWHQENIWV